MKYFLKYAFAVALVVVPVVSFAADFRAGQDASVGAKEVLPSNAYLAGATVTSAGAVTGDVTAAGGSVLVSGPVGADVLAAGGTVTVLSDIPGDVRVAGGNILIDGKVGGDVVVGGGQVVIAGAGVEGDVLVGAGTVRIGAPVAGKVIVRGGSVYIDAPIQGNVDIQADTVTLGKDAVIQGSLTYTASKEFVQEDGAVVNGKVTFTQHARRAAPAAAMAAFVSVWLLVKSLVLLMCALLLSYVLRRFSKEVVTKATERPWFELFRGFCVVVLLPIVSGILLVTLVGIPLGILGFLSLGALLVVSWIVSPIVVGSIVYHYFSKKEYEVSWKTTLLGVVIYSLVSIIPLVGWLAAALLLFVVVNIVATLVWGALSQWR